MLIEKLRRITTQYPKTKHSGTHSKTVPQTQTRSQTPISSRCLPRSPRAKARAKKTSGRTRSVTTRQRQTHTKTGFQTRSLQQATHLKKRRVTPILTLPHS